MGRFRDLVRRRKAGNARKGKAQGVAAAEAATAERAIAVQGLVLALWAAATATKGKRYVLN